jgi:hypothetical protein
MQRTKALANLLLPLLLLLTFPDRNHAARPKKINTHKKQKSTKIEI